MSFSNCEHDRRVILLGKALTLSRDHYRTHTEGSTPAQLVSLGYFDSIKIYPLPENGQTDGWLKSVWEHSIAISGDPNPNAYYHPLYIIDPLGKDVPTDFWKADYRFLFVSLVHFTFAHTKQTAVTGDSNLFATVSDQVTAIAERAGKWVRALCYHSMDLSDMVVIWKSDSLVTLLNCLNQLYLYESVGDLHSICSFPFPATPNVADESESIPYVSFRFGTRSTEAVASFDKQLNQKWPKWPVSGGYFTTGTEDVDIVFEKLLVSEFLELIHFWFEDKEINGLFRQAFYESSTHLGVLSETFSGNSGNSGGDTPESISTILTSRCEELFKDFQALRVSPGKQSVQTMTETQIGLSWCKSVSSQLSALVDMSRMCVLDGFCYLILDGVETFCHMIKPYLVKGRPLPYVQLEQIQRFIRGWGTLVDQAVRADGQFIQSPGFSPTLYDIPVSLLEFYIAFTTRCIDMMQSPEDSAKHYALFLLPKLCRKTKVNDIFQHEPPHDRLLYVDIPLDFLYDPQQILLQLCHEVSHYCGEDMRCRQARVWYFTYACAHLIAWYFQIDNKAAVDRIYQDLRRVLPAGGQLYMENLSSQMKECAVTLIRDEQTFLAWQESYLSANSTFLPQSFQPENNKRRRTVVYGVLLALQELGEDMNRVSRLFEEGYADVSMIFMLTPSWEEYLSLYRQELEWLFELYELEDSGSQYAELVQRAAIVLWAVELSPSQAFNKNDTRLLRFSADVSQLYQALCLDKELAPTSFSTDLYKNLFPANLLYNVAHYLRGCYQKMETAAIRFDEREFIKRTFSQVARNHCVYCTEFQQTQAQYEKKLLQI